MQARGGTLYALRQDVETPKTSPQLGKDDSRDIAALGDTPFEVRAQCNTLSVCRACSSSS